MVKEIEYTSGKRIVFDYNPMGNRIAKKVYQNTTLLSATFYALDAQGNTMNVYTFAEDDEKLYLSERNIYGSSRIGQERLKQEMTLNPPGNGSNYMAMNESGDKYYELSNHLGNVLNVVTDRKIPVEGTGGSAGTVAYYDANVLSYSDYYPFGMVMPGRSGSSGDYRYGYNGMEMDDEIKNHKGTSYDFGARIYDPRVGRWFSRDALAGTKPQLSPYQAFRNSPILYMDPDGNDEYISIIIKDKSGKTIHTIRGHEAVSNKVRAGAIREAGNSTTLYETQNFYDFRTVYTATMNEDGNLEIDPTPVYYTLTDRKRYSKTMFSSILSGYKTGAIIDPNASGFDWTLEGKGGNQRGGYTLTSKGGGASPTKTRSLSPAEERNIEGLLTYLGAGNRSLYHDLPKNGELGGTLKNLLNNVKAIVEESQGGGKKEYKSPSNPSENKVIVVAPNPGQNGPSKLEFPMDKKEVDKSFYGKYSPKKDTFYVEVN